MYEVVGFKLWVWGFGMTASACLFLVKDGRFS